MIDFLLGVPGKLKSISDYLTTYWTAARAAKLDYLTANVAVASTAVSNAHYTSARAAKLDILVDNPAAKPPVSFNVQSNKVMQMPLGFYAGVWPGLESANTSSTSLVDILNITSGSGVLEFLAAGQGDETSGRTVRMVVTIDGTTVYDNTATSGGANIVATLLFAGALGVTYSWDGSVVYAVPIITALSNIPFTTSLRIQMSVSASNGSCYFKYRRAS